MVIPNPDKPEPKGKKFITKARKYEDTKFWLFFFFVFCGVRLVTRLFRNAVAEQGVGWPWGVFHGEVD
jgi:hypothetical protein